MRRPKALISVAAALVVVAAIVVGGIAIAGGSGGDEGTTATPAPSEPPGGSATPPGLGGFPPEFIQCLKDKGVNIEGLEGLDPNEIFHGGAVPPETLNTCFGVLHGGGGAP
jgi:hypothetical protein